MSAARPPLEPTLGDLTFDLAPAALRAASEARLARCSKALAELSSFSGRPGVESFLRPLDRCLTEVRDLSAHGGLLFSVHPDEPTRVAGREVSEAADRFFNAFRLEAPIYRSLQALDLSDADEPTRYAVVKMRREMRRAGVEQPEDRRARLLELTNEIDRVSNQYTENIAKARRSIEVDGPRALAGLPDDYRRAHPPDARGTVRITTDYPDFRPVMAYAEDGALRRRLLFEFANRAYPENTPVLERLLELRHEFATALGYESFAAFALEDKMMGTPAAAEEFLTRVGGLTNSAAQSELARLLERKRRDEPTAARIENWDIGLFAEGYYPSKIRSEEYGVDTKALRPYLPYGPVRDGLFALCGELFGLAFRRLGPEGRWHETVESYDVTLDGRTIGRFYLDMVPREGKFSHAACFGVREGILDRQLPQSALVCNFLDPRDDPATARMEYSDVVTFFHEFGHLLHAILSGQAPWLFDSQSLIEWDFVEAPSQLFEEWARDPATLRRFARDPSTGASIPAELLERLKSSEALGRASRWARQVGLSEASLKLYAHDPAGRDPAEVMRSAYDRHAPIPLDPEYHTEAGWGHLTSYSAFYYTYVWSLVIARDLLRPFEEKGTLSDPELARRYAREILAPASIRPAARLVEAFLGRPFNFEAFERWVNARPSSTVRPS